MTVGVLTTCHTQFTWDRSICIFLFNRTTLQVFVTYLIGALYVHPLWFYKHQHDNLKCIVHDKLLKPRQSFRITLYKLELCRNVSCNWFLYYSFPIHSFDTLQLRDASMLSRIVRTNVHGVLTQHVHFVSRSVQICEANFATHRWLHSRAQAILFNLPELFLIPLCPICWYVQQWPDTW